MKSTTIMVTEVCTGGVNFEVVQGSRANTYMYVDKTDGYSYGKERESKGSVFLRCRWFNKSKDTGSKCHARAILKMDESIGQYRLTRTKEHNCDPDRRTVYMY